MTPQSVFYRTFQLTEVEILADLFIRAAQSVYPDLEDGPWISDLHNIEDYYSHGGDW